jgi:hypothetical protein
MGLIGRKVVPVMKEAPFSRSGAYLRPRRWDLVAGNVLQGVCISAVQLSDRRDRSCCWC